MTTGAPTSEASFPQHVAIIMDGNGRWAQARGQARTFGHKQGVETVRAIVKHASQIGLKHLTLYGFSSENWSRPPQEVSFLMGLLKSYFGARLAELLAGNVQVKVIGEHSAFSDEIRELLEKAERESAGNDGLTLCIALSYGGRGEIVRATQRALAAGYDASGLTERVIADHLDLPDLPDPDLIIRTSGEQRLSNFLIWQAAYAEFYFTDVLWPDFSGSDLDEAIAAFRRRSRRFGGLEAEDVERGASGPEMQVVSA